MGALPLFVKVQCKHFAVCADANRRRQGFDGIHFFPADLRVQVFHLADAKHFKKRVCLWQCKTGVADLKLCAHQSVQTVPHFFLTATFHDKGNIIFLRAEQINQHTVAFIHPDDRLGFFQRAFKPGNDRKSSVFASIDHWFQRFHAIQQLSAQRKNHIRDPKGSLPFCFCSSIGIYPFFQIFSHQESVFF